MHWFRTQHPQPSNMAKKKLTAQDAEAITPDEILGYLQGGIEFVGAATPIIKVLYDKIAEAIKNLGGPNSPQGRRRRIEALEAQNLLQKEVNKVNDARLKALEDASTGSA